MRRPDALVMTLLLALLGAGCGERSTEADMQLLPAQALAARDGHPLIVLVRDEDDDQAIALGHRLQAAARAHRLPEDAHLALVWRQDPAASSYPPVPGAGTLSCLACLPRGAPPTAGLSTYAVPRAADDDLAVVADVISGGPHLPGPPPIPNDALARAYVHCTQGDRDADPQARQQLLGALRARLADPDSTLQLAWLDYLVYLVDDAALRHRLEAVIAAWPVSRDVLATEFDLADEALSAGEAARATTLYARVAAAQALAPVLARSAAAMRDLPQEAASPVRRAWEARRCWDGVVLVHDRASFCAALRFWTPTTYFPILFDEDHFAPRFISAFHPAQVIRLRADASVVDAERLRGALLASWGAPDATPSAAAIRARLRELGLSAHGLVVTTLSDDACTAALALAAARFQGLAIAAGPVDAGQALGHDAILTYAQATGWADVLNQTLDAWVAPTDAWRFLTLCGGYPYRWSANQEAMDHINCLDDLIGRDPDRTRTAVVGRLVEGQSGESTYQAMCALFLQPHRSFGFDTYQQNPFSGFGDNCLAPFAPGRPGQLPGTWVIDGSLNDLQDVLHTWNQADAVYLATAGGPDWFFARYVHGSTEDMPVGVPCVMQVEHSYSAADPWDAETLAGRCLWGGAYVYTGSVAEPYLNAFQSPRYIAPRLVQGLPLAALMRTHAGEFKSKPWRLIYLGDPQFCWRATALQRVPGPSPLPADRCEELASPSPAPIAALRLATRLGTSDRLPALVAQLAPLPSPPAMPALEVADCRLALECALTIGQVERARQLWLRASPTLRADVQVRRLARSALNELLAQARRAQDLPRYAQAWAKLTATRPPHDDAQRRLGDGTVLAASLHQDAAWVTLLAALPVAPPYDAMISQILAAQHLAALLRQERWQESDTTAVLADLRLVAETGADASALLRWLDQIMVHVDRQNGDGSAVLQALRGPGTPPPNLVQALTQLAARAPYFRDWQILGPLPESEERISRAVEHGTYQPVPPPPLGAADALRWQRPFTPSDHGYVDLNGILGAHDHVHAYARCLIEVGHAVDGVIMLGSDDGASLRLDGVVIHRSPGPRALTPDQDVIPVSLTQGVHELLLRVDQGSGDWGFSLRLATAADGATPLAVTLRNPLDVPGPPLP